MRSTFLARDICEMRYLDPDAVASGNKSPAALVTTSKCDLFLVLNHRGLLFLHVTFAKCDISTPDMGIVITASQSCDDVRDRERRHARQE
jgi:hypothetical protein